MFRHSNTPERTLDVLKGHPSRFYGYVGGLVEADMCPGIKKSPRHGVLSSDIEDRGSWIVCSINKIPERTYDVKLFLGRETGKEGVSKTTWFPLRTYVLCTLRS